MIPRQNLILPVGKGIFPRLVGTQLLKPKKVTFFLYAAITFPFCASPPSCKRKTLMTKWDPMYIFMYIYEVWCWKNPAARNPGCFGTGAILKSTGALCSWLSEHLPKLHGDVPLSLSCCCQRACGCQSGRMWEMVAFLLPNQSADFYLDWALHQFNNAIQCHNWLPTYSTEVKFCSLKPNQSKSLCFLPAGAFLRKPVVGCKFWFQVHLLRLAEPSVWEKICAGVASTFTVFNTTPDFKLLVQWYNGEQWNHSLDLILNPQLFIWVFGSHLHELHVRFSLGSLFGTGWILSSWSQQL